MGGAVSAVSGAVSGIFGGASNPVQSIMTPISSGIIGPISGAGGQALGSLAQGIIGAIPDVPIANQQNVQNQINTNSNMASALAGGGIVNQNLANQQQGMAQGAIQNAQQVNQGPDSNVNQAVGLLGQTAAGGGPAQQAASAQLQQGTNAAIQSQQAMANSGNLSQMIGGQRQAMTNAANLQQQNALSAAQLQAGMAGNAQGQFAGAAGQQAGQASQNAGLQSGLYNTAQNASLGQSGQAISAQGNALTGQTNALGIQQQALGQTGQNKALAVSGVLNAAGGAGTAALGSDMNMKEDIQYASGPRAGTSLTGSSPDSSQLSMLNYDKQPSSMPQSSSESKPKVAPKFDYFHMGAPSTAQWQNIPLSSDKGMKTDIAYSQGKIPLNSDEQEKTDKHPHADNKIKSFLDAVDPVSFKYKESDGKMGRTPGEHLGVLAQQIEKAPGGASMVEDTPEGKVIDVPSSVGTLLAASADLNQRLSELEELFKSKKESKKDKK